MKKLGILVAWVISAGMISVVLQQEAPVTVRSSTAFEAVLAALPGIIEALAKLLWALGPMVAAYYAWKAAGRTQVIETKTDKQTATINEISEKAKEAAEIAKTVDEKTDDQTKKLEDITQIASENHSNVNGNFDKLQQRLEQAMDVVASALDALKTYQPRQPGVERRAQVAVQPPAAPVTIVVSPAAPPRVPDPEKQP